MAPEEIEYYVIYSLRPYKKKLFSRVRGVDLYEARQKAIAETGGMFAMVIFPKEFEEYCQKYEMIPIVMSPTVHLVNPNSV